MPILEALTTFYLAGCVQGRVKCGHQLRIRGAVADSGMSAPITRAHCVSCLRRDVHPTRLIDSIILFQHKSHDTGACIALKGNSSRRTNSFKEDVDVRRDKYRGQRQYRRVPATMGDDLGWAVEAGGGEKAGGVSKMRSGFLLVRPAPSSVSIAEWPQNECDDLVSFSTRTRTYKRRSYMWILAEV